MVENIGRSPWCVSIMIFILICTQHLPAEVNVDGNARFNVKFIGIVGTSSSGGEIKHKAFPSKTYQHMKRENHVSLAGQCYVARSILMCFSGELHPVQAGLRPERIQGEMCECYVHGDSIRKRY